MRSITSSLVTILASMLGAAAVAFLVSTHVRESSSPAWIVRNAMPSVVNITVKRRAGQQPSSQASTVGAHDQNNAGETTAAGSGVVIDAENGLIVTDNHVIADAVDIAVALADGRQLQGTRVGADAATDIAVIKVPAKDLKTIPLGDSDKLRMGDFVVALGNPFGFGQTATFGIVSGLRRSGLGIERYESFIQTDAAINPGNSGGALINLKGELIGINTAIFGPTGANVGIGFAIPINMVSAVTGQIMKYGDVRHGELGILMVDVTAEVRSERGLPPGQAGALITKVNPDSAASRAGLWVGDVITAVGGVIVRDSAEVVAQLGLRRASDRVELTIIRDGKSRRISVVLQDTGHAARPPTETR
jgi:S1-C subfamily serine protease